MFESVILDGELLFALINQGVREKFIFVKNPIFYKEFCDITVKYVNETATETMLENLVLFDKLYLPIELRFSDTFDCKMLIREEIVELLNQGFVDYVSAFKKGDQESNIILTARYLRPLIYSRFYRVMKGNQLFEFMEMVSNRFNLPFNYYIRRSFVDKFLKFIESGRCYELLELGESKEISGKDLINMGLGNNVVDVHLGAWLTSRYKANDITPYFFLHDAAFICYIFDQSSLNGWPIISDLFKTRAYSFRKIKFPEILYKANIQLNSFHLFRVVMNELGPCMPIIKSIEDALRLREDKRIHRFRNRLAELIKGIKEGDVMNIKDMRLAVLDANKSLKNIGVFKRLTRLTAYLSLPLGIAESLIGLPVFGLSLGLIGGVSQVILDYTRLKHDWILIGCND